MKLNNISETLFIPLYGRVYATKNYPDLLNDQASCSLIKKIPDDINKIYKQTEYTYLASAVRAFNIDKEVREFLTRFPKGTIVNLGCGLDTTFNRVDNGLVTWISLDLKNVIDLRKELLDESSRNIFITKSFLDNSFIDDIKNLNCNGVLFIAAGLFHYFHSKEIIKFLEMLKKELLNCEIIFDTVSNYGLKKSNKYVRKLGKTDALMYFYINNLDDFVSSISAEITQYKSYPFYQDAIPII